MASTWFKSLLIGGAFLVLSHVLRVNGAARKPCKPGFYLSVDLFYNCIDCPVSCDDQYTEDIEPCKKACGQTSTASKLVTQQKTDQIDNENATTSSNVGTTQSSLFTRIANWQNGYKTTARNESRKTKTTQGRVANMEDRGLSERNVLVIVIGVVILVVFLLITSVGVVLVMKNNRNTVTIMKSTEEENLGMCPRHSNSSASSALHENQESEEPTVGQQTTDVNVGDSTEDCSSVISMDETQF